MDHKGIAVHLTRGDCEGFLQNFEYPMQWMKLMMMCCAVRLERMGMLGV
jgi:hypothetical protein